MSVIINSKFALFFFFRVFYFEILAMAMLAIHGHRYPMEVTKENLRKNLTGIG